MKLNIHISTYILIIASISTANAAYYQFTQGGFPENGAITGIFEARDIAGSRDDMGLPIPDGIISYCGSARCEDPSTNDYVRLVYAHFYGNPMLEGLNPHTKGRMGISGISFDPNNNAFNFLQLEKSDNCNSDCTPGGLPSILYVSGLAGGSGLIQINSASSYVSPYYVDKYEAWEGSNQIYLDSRNAISISQVPLPSAFGLFGLGMIWLTRWINSKQA